MDILSTIFAYSLNALILLITPLVSAFIIFNFGRMLLSNKIYHDPIASKAYVFFGLICIPIHELSHLAMAILFGHKVNAVKLLSWRTPAYVTHSYDPRSSIQVMGNFFIAIAPFITSTILVHQLTLYPMNLLVDLTLNPGSTFLQGLLIAPTLFQSFLMTNQWWEVLLTIMLSFYCVPSNTDFNNALQSALLSFPVFFIAVFLGTAFFIGMGQVVGIVLFMGILSTLTAFFGWLLFYFITFIPTLR